MERPDETNMNGYEGETVLILTQSGDAAYEVLPTDLIGVLDDGAKYRLIATVTDAIGQVADYQEEFEVHWSHQALMPDMTETLDTSNLVSVLTPIAPEGTETGDTFDIYRLSADRPELIIKDGDWNTVYVDPYPTIGEFGGHRIVFKTANGDYITEDHRPAWTDVNPFEEDELILRAAIINFDGDLIVLNQNLDVSNEWTKDFTETKYLGGAVQGDWNPAVSRKTTINAVVQVFDDPDLIQTMRRLATFPGICHVRTPEGSSYAADIQVSESIGYGAAGKIVKFDLSITRVDPETLDGITYDQWSGGGT